MGYITQFSFTRAEGSKKEFSEMMKELGELLEDSWFEQTNEYEGKWYDQDKDCRELAEKHPDVGFIVHGVGEDPEDIWQTYYKGEQCYTKEVDFDFPTWEEAKEIMEHPSAVRGALRAIDKSYDLLLKAVIRAVGTGKGFNVDDAFGYVYDESDDAKDEDTVLEMRVTDMRAQNGKLEAYLTAIQREHKHMNDWYTIDNNLYGNYRATLYSIALALLD